jgi:hypothetical protein
MSERMKHEPSNYSSQEVVERVKVTLIHIKDELAGQFKSELVGDWYHWLLRVELNDSDPYKAIVAHEVEGKLSYTFENLRLGPDGEICYRGCTIDADHPELYSELVSEALRQHDWAKRRQERQTEMQQRAQLSDDLLWKLREEFPTHARGILVHSQQDCTFNLTLTGLTSDRLREVIKITELGVPTDYGCKNPSPKS